MSLRLLPASLVSRALRRLRREAWVIAITALSLVVRLYWNLVIHPPRNFVFSDMGGYFDRTTDFISQPLTGTYDYLAFFPWGTHAFLGLVRAIFTTPTSCPAKVKAIAADGCWPMDASLAVLGALGVLYTMLLARRLTAKEPGNVGRPGPLYILVGLGLALYYPLIAQGGFFMSEIPFFACLSAATYHLVRLSDEGKTRDAVLFGLFAGLGALARPQMLMSIAFLGVFWLFRRRHLRGLTLRKLVWAGVPLALILAFSAVRTTRHLRQHDPSELALVSTNDALNYAFGRCHPIAIEARLKGYRSFFGPPSLGSLYFSVRDRKKKGLWSPFELFPAFPDDRQCDINKKHIEKREPTEPCLSIEGKMWSRDVLGQLASKCVQKTGMLQQAYYGLTHVALNYGLNLTWPDAGQPQRDTWVSLRPSSFGRSVDPHAPWSVKISTGRPVMEWWQEKLGLLLLPLGTLGCVLAFRRRRARDGLLAMHIWAMHLVGILYFGDTRLRTPYDGLFMILAVASVVRLVQWSVRAARRAAR